MAVATSIFALTIYLIIARPRNLNSGAAAMFGAALALATGVVSQKDLVTVAGIIWNATFALVAIIVISVLLDQAGFFRWAALHMARRAGGRGRRAFVAVILLAAATSTLFTNDATVLIMTPIVIEMLLALGFDQRAALPFIMACGFVADSMSIPLSVSNLTNIIVADYFDLDFVRFAARMAIPSVVSLLSSLGVLYWYYHRDIPAVFDLRRVDEPRSAIRDPFMFRLGMGVLAVMVVAFLLGSLTGVPVSLVIAAGAAALLAGTRVNRVIDPWTVIKQAPWHVVTFSLGMYLVVYGLRNAGSTAWLQSGLERFAGGGTLQGVMGAGLLVAVLSSVMNNLPAVMVGVLMVSGAAVTPAVREGMIYATVVGADLGPKMTPIGSLATLIWLHFLNLKGIRISWPYYLKVGITVTPPVLILTSLGLWVSLLITR